MVSKQHVTKETITIIGAGIGGLVTALTLRQQGYAVHIYEGATEIKPVGAGIIMANNAMQVFKSLGLDQQVEKAGNRISAMKITDSDLNVLSGVDLKDFEKQYKVCNTAIHRGVLQQLLVKALGNEHISLSKRLLRIEKEDDYHLYFEDGSINTARWLIGADGIHSVVRKQLFPTSSLRDAKQTCWRGVSEMDLPAAYHHELNEAWGKGKRFGFVKIGPNKVYWYALVNENAKEKDLTKSFRDFHSDIQSIVSQCGDSAIFTSNIADLKPIDCWQQEQVCLVGDAAHATTPNLGQGACQAIEDAYVLGKLLAKEQDIQTAFQQYEAIRMPKALQVVSSSRIVGRLAHVDNRLGVWLRNNLMKNIPASANRKQLESIFKLQMD
ncbi:FAD-dependent monooxygenase [Chryseobacterium sp.]|uniref:FAD-dependent monooxygenase n=1 Tax=Chryseobacterium sp. TaxID=1871047 RepID=UPI0025C706AB|nr:FAD-dependent monooxygenase [Chryseobacterium sp.]MBV8325220.1 FAD-dependent monooxygenase [Chryseobacterium sp.]